MSHAVYVADDSVEDLHPWENPMRYIMWGVESFLLVVTAVIVTVDIFMIIRRALFHENFRFLLILVLSAQFGYCVITLLDIAFILWEGIYDFELEIGYYTYTVEQMFVVLNLMATMCTNFERVIAVVHKKTYENSVSVVYKIAILFFVVTISVLFVVAEQNYDPVGYIMMTFCIVLPIGGVITFTIVWMKTRRSKETKHIKGLSLGERFQIEENLRSSKVMLLVSANMTINLFATFGVLIYNIFILPYDYGYNSGAIMDVYSLLNAEQHLFTVLVIFNMYHPIFRCSREKRRIQMDIHNHNDMNEYFRTMNKAWAK